MLLKPLLSAIRPIFSTTINQIRYLRPYIKIGKERFQLTVDCSAFTKEGLWIKAHPEYLIIAGKQEKSSKQGFVRRQFIRKFKLPGNCIPQQIKSNITPQGILTIIAPRRITESNKPCKAMYIPITCRPIALKRKKSKQAGQKKGKKEQKKLAPKVNPESCVDYFSQQKQ